MELNRSSNKVIVDANVFIAYYTESETLHEQARYIFDLIREKEIVVPYCIIQEVCTVLSYKQGKKTADHFLDEIKKAQNVQMTNDNLTTEIEYFKSRPEKLGFTDLALLHLSKEWNAQLITFDKQLLKLYKKSNSR